MKKHEYVEGQKALENFEKGMKAIFNASKEKAGAKKKRSHGSASSHKAKTSDRD